MDQKTEQFKTIYIEIDEEISSIVSKLKKIKQKDIYLVIPLKSLFSTSVVNLKILKEFSKQNNKNVFLVTKDKATSNLASSVWLSVYSNNPQKIHNKATVDIQEKRKKINLDKILYNFNEEKNFKKEDNTGSISQPKLKELIPEEKSLEKFSIEEIIAQTKNEATEPLNINQEEVNLEEKETAQNQKNYLKFNFSIKKFLKKFWQKLKKKDFPKKNTYYSPNRFILSSFIIFSLLLFLFVIYIVLPSSKIYITPKFEKLDYSTSIHFLLTKKETSPQQVFSEFDQNTVIARKIEIITDKTMFFPTTGEKAIGPKASGYITIYNKSHLDKHFIPSRFMTSDGLIFWTQESITVPAKGILNVFVKAADYDINNQAIGNRGNISAGQTLTLPALPSSSPSLYYAVNQNNFNNANVEIKRTVTKYDLEFAKKEIIRELESQAQKKMEEYIAEQNILNKTNMQLLKDDGLLSYEVIETNIPENIIGQMQDDFVVYGKLKVTGFEYNMDDLLAILKEGLEKKIKPNMTLTKAESKDIEINPTEEKDDTHIKVEATISGVTAYDFSPTSITGQKMNKQIKEAVIGKTIEQTYQYLRNMEEIFDLKIENWPVWSKSMPNVESGIEIILKE